MSGTTLLTGTTTAPSGAAAVSVVRRRLAVRGIVQGVGFRPFVWRQARRHGLNGSVCNTSGAVVIEVEGPTSAVDRFAAELLDRAPPLARIRDVTAMSMPVTGAVGFVIDASRTEQGCYQAISPDAATCTQCVAELFDAGDRRFRYPFINCTECGPRFTIIQDVPYDRALTTMRSFPMCEPCRREYEDPADRRFHAQPNACPACGPQLDFVRGGRSGADGDDTIAVAAAAMRSGAIVALKGLGGFQLSCFAGDDAAVWRLRERKRRPTKPFAVMVSDLDAVRRLCEVSAEEAAVLAGTARPVVLLRRRRQAPDRLSSAVAPALDELGVMLPYTPLHHLLLRDAAGTLVMTSGNLTEEPIARDNDEALERLGGIADAFLLHDREICARYDDSVVRIVAGGERVIRRARGYCPTPTEIAEPAPDVLALGGHLKNTFTVLKDGQAFVGPHLGDLDQPLTLRHHGEALATYLRLFRAHPRVVACDLHPDYASTAIAERWWEAGAGAVRVQHHHAHIASVMAEHGIRGSVLGVAFDGTGYGPDGTIWGGEFLVCDEASYRRVGHLAPVRQPGGDLCAREGWRMAVAYLTAGGLLEEQPLAWMRDLEGAPDARRWRLVGRVAASTTAAPVTTSAGRLFDAVASLLGVAHSSSFEAEAAMRLETVARSQGTDSVPALTVAMTGVPLVLDTPGLVGALVRERGRGRRADELAAVFHESLARAIAEACRRLGAETGVRRVALSGGVFQNALLLGRTLRLLEELDLDVYTNRVVPANDGGISLGQALVAAAQRTRHEQVAP